MVPICIDDRYAKRYRDARLALEAQRGDQARYERVTDILLIPAA
jgi:hypothetical protein